MNNQIRTVFFKIYLRGNYKIRLDKRKQLTNIYVYRFHNMGSISLINIFNCRPTWKFMRLVNDSRFSNKRVK
jgi:hypothetical protein